MQTMLFKQIIGIIATGCFLISYQAKSNKMLYLWQVIGNTIFVVQFILLGGLSGSLGLILCVLRNILLSKIDDWKFVRKKITAAMFVCAAIIISIITWNGAISILPMIAVAGGTIGYWTNNARKVRITNLFCTAPAWIIYDTLILSLGGVMTELITVVSILISIYRYGWKSLGENKFEK